jgi:uncharacterized protein
MFPFLFDPTFVILIPAMIFVFYAQYRVKATFHEWARVHSQRGVTGAELARQLLYGANISDVSVEFVDGELTDHYDPRAKVVRLSRSTYHSASVAALGVAAHEVGHAIQHDVGYLPLQVRNLVWPVARIGDMFGPMLVIAGFFFQSGFLMDLGILIFTLAVGFYIITLPVEFNASTRAIAILDQGGYLNRDELGGARRVLNAAALTYLAGAAVAISQLIRLLLIRNSRN